MWPHLPSGGCHHGRTVWSSSRLPPGEGAGTAVGLQPGSGPPALSCHLWAREGQAGLGTRPELWAPRGRGRALTPGAHPRSPASSVSVGQTYLTLTRRPAQPGQDSSALLGPGRPRPSGRHPVDAGVGGSAGPRRLERDPGLRGPWPRRRPAPRPRPGPRRRGLAPGCPAEGPTPPQPEAAGASRAHVCRLSLRLRLFAHASPACPSFHLLLRKNTAQRRFF